MTVYVNVRSALVSKFNCRLNWTSRPNRDRKIARESDRIIDLLSLRYEAECSGLLIKLRVQRHLELAFTIAREPTLVMLDEPTAGLNSEETKSVVHLIRKLTEGKTLIMVEHDMEVVFDLADRITVLSSGRVLATGSVDEIRNNEEVKKVYLGRK